MTVLVLAEDDDDIRAITARILRRAGYDVVETADGAAALEAVAAHRPTALVSDIDMPVMSGIELCLAVRADPATRDLPVIVVSGSLTPGDTRPQQAQATAIVSKPFLPRELVACVQKAIEAGHQDASEGSAGRRTVT